MKSTIKNTIGGASSALTRPDQIKAWLDERVIGQEEAKVSLSVAVYNHYKRLLHRGDPRSKVHLDKSNIILLGETGCGKTLLMKSIAEFLDVPCYIQDCTKITASGYVGSDVEDCLAGLLRACDYDMERAQRGIIVLDEGDKIARKEAGISITRDVSGECVQQSLLKIVEGDLVGVPPMGGRKHPEQPLLYVDTTDILFVLSGAFVGLDGIVAHRTGSDKNRIGFLEAPVEDNAGASNLGDVTPADLREFGLIPEFIGRFPVITHVDPLRREDLLRILTEPRNAIISQYKELLREDGIALSFGDDALEAIVDETLKLSTGARGLRLVLEKTLQDIMYRAPLLAEEGTTKIRIGAKDIRHSTRKDLRKAE